MLGFDATSTQHVACSCSGMEQFSASVRAPGVKQSCMVHSEARALQSAAMRTPFALLARSFCFSLQVLVIDGEVLLRRLALCFDHHCRAPLPLCHPIPGTSSKLTVTHGLGVDNEVLLRRVALCPDQCALRRASPCKVYQSSR